MPFGRTARRIGWMVAIWTASVAATAALGYALRLILL